MAPLSSPSLSSFLSFNLQDFAMTITATMIAMTATADGRAIQAAEMPCITGSHFDVAETNW